MTERVRDRESESSGFRPARWVRGLYATALETTTALYHKGGYLYHLHFIVMPQETWRNGWQVRPRCSIGGV